ncbi:MAG: RNA polymerase-associated protein RapA [Mycoplasmataceae bacterium]|nr:MAG: RNA polymerase-associated protein RapA [Mycoplasmataceae bacterium]
MNDEFKLDIIELIRKDRFVFRANYGWITCLNADREKEKRIFSLPLTHENFVKLKNILPNYKFNISNSDFLSSKEELKKKELRPYQKADIAFLSKMNSVAIFNEMRTGKTPTSLILTKEWSVDNLLIITPGILQSQWQNSVKDWLKKPSYIISELDKEERKLFYKKFSFNKDFIIIVSKEIFKSDSDYFSEFRKENSSEIVDFCVIVDEAHFLRNYKSQQSESIYSLNDSKYKIVITGTPIVNSYSDIFGTLKFINNVEYNSYWRFVELFFNIQTSDFIKDGRRVFLKSVNNFKSRTSEIQLKNEIASFSVSRKQKDVLPWLPQIIREKEYLLMGESQQSLYDRYLNSSEEYSLELLANLKSVILYPKYINKDIKDNGIKIDYLVNFCKENESEQILIFSTRSETFLEPLSYLLKEKKINHGIIIGKVDKEQREIYIRDFQNSKIKILLCNISSAGFGLNLNQADTIIFADRSYSPADNDQAEARFLPIKKEQSVKVKTIIDLVCKKTIDEKILKLLEKKKDITKIINSNPNLLFD